MGAYVLSLKRYNDLASVDRMDPGLKACVHEFGLPIVNVLVKFGVRDPRHIREVVKECWHGARQDGQKSGALNTLDVLLSHGPLSAAALMRLLNDNNMSIVPLQPTRAMLEASMAEVSGFNERMTKEEKHRRRLSAALRSHLTPKD